MTNQKKEEIIDKVKQIKEYCETFACWPKFYKETKTAQETLSNSLYKWLKKSHYIDHEEEFLYKSVVDEAGMNIVTTLDYYYFKYGVNSLWEAKDSFHLATSSYYYILALWQAKDKGDRDMAEYYKAALKEKLKKENSDLNIDEIIEVLDKKIGDIQTFFLEKYTEFSTKNISDWAFFYKNLYSYSLVLQQEKLKTTSRV